MTDTVQEIVQVFAAPDGTQFTTRKEAKDYMRAPQITAALLGVTANNADLAAWLSDNRNDVSEAFTAGTVKRVSAKDKKSLETALDAAVANHRDDVAYSFLVQNREAIIDSFRFPTVKRMDDGEKAATVKSELTSLADGDEEVAEFILANKDAILEAFKAGTVKREITPAAQEGLRKYQAEQRALKEAREATEATASKKTAKK